MNDFDRRYNCAFTSYNPKDDQEQPPAPQGSQYLGYKSGTSSVPVGARAVHSRHDDAIDLLGIALAVFFVVVFPWVAIGLR